MRKLRVNKEEVTNALPDKTFRVTTTEEHMYACTYFVKAKDETDAKLQVRSGSVGIVSKELIEREPDKELIRVVEIEEE